MRDLDEILNPASGRDILDRAAEAAHGSDAGALASRGVRRGRRRRALAVAGVVGATALALGLGPQVIGDELGAERPPADLPGTREPSPDESDLADTRGRDLAPEQVPQVPGATVEQAVVGADLDHRAVVWRARGRTVLARTTDGGASWEYSGEPGQFFALHPVPGDSDSFLVDVHGGRGHVVVEALLDPTGEQVPLTPPRGMGPVADGEVLAMHRPHPDAERQVAVAPDGTTHHWPGDPFVEQQRTGVVGGWQPAEQLPTGVLVQQVAGAQEELGGYCCAARSVVRWSGDGGTTWTTRELDAFGADPDAIYPFTATVPSLDPEIVAVHESTEGGTATGRPLLATHRFAADGSDADRYADQFPAAEVDAAWSAVLPDGELLVWIDGPGRLAGPWLSTDGDWGEMRRAVDLAPPADVDARGLALTDLRLVDGAARVVAVAPSGAMLLLEDGDVTWTRVDAAD